MSLKSIAKKQKIPLYSYMNEEELEDVLSDEVLSIGWRWNHIQKFIEKKERENVMDLLLSDVRDLSKYRKVMNYLKNNKVIISLTTSPNRLKKIYAVLCSLDIEYVDHISIVLPKFYGKHKEKYNESDIKKCKQFPKVKVVRTNVDYGPITKIIPTMEKAKKKDIIISIDDDICYPMGMVNEMIYSKIVRYPKSVVSTPMEGFHMRDYISNFENTWPHKERKRAPYIDIVEGWTGIAYDKCSANIEMMKQFASISKPCYLSDDLVISYVLDMNNIPRVSIHNKYIYSPHPYELGTGDDALHKGGGADVKPSGIGNHDDSYNFEKYSICLEDIKRITKCPHCPVKHYHTDLYRLLQGFQDICNREEIIYWANFGTLLGMYRDHKLIEWEDHIDVGMVVEDVKILKDILKKGDYRLSYQKNIYSFEKKSISNTYTKQNIPEPKIHIYTYKIPRQSLKIESSYSSFRKKYPSNFFMDSHLFPLKEYPFGEMIILGPSKPKYYIQRMYKKWETPIKTIDNPYLI